MSCYIFLFFNWASGTQIGMLDPRSRGSRASQTLRLGVFNVAKRSNMVQPSNRNPTIFSDLLRSSQIFSDLLRSQFSTSPAESVAESVAVRISGKSARSSGKKEEQIPPARSRRQHWYHVAPVPLGWTSMEDGSRVFDLKQATKPTPQRCGWWTI